MFFYLHCGRGFNCLYGGRTNRCLTSWSLCDNPEPVSVNTKRYVTLDASESHRLLYASHWTQATSAFCVIAARPVLIVTCVQSSDVSESLGWSPYRQEWSWLMPSPCQHLSDKGAPIGACTTRLRVLGVVSIERVVFVDLPHCQTIVIFRAAGRIIWTWRLKGKIVAKVGVALLCPPTMWCIIFFLVGLRNHYDISYFFYKQHTSPFRTGNIATLHFQRNLRTANTSNSKISTEWSRNSVSCLVV